ncbi:engulfment and cell motility Ced-12 isoform X2 [Leptinotarsa decemlineata]|uniref:engulfment and cell motility Ced-12 isoform X2 n=1 Tax=Leptinotarsa decemlineata TaxID=7539 RepID=UPI003D306E82
MPAMKDASIVKIAVEMTDQVPQLIEFNQKQPLAGIIQELCNGWNLTDPEQYALQFNENNNSNYITEKNRNEIKNGSVLRLQNSPSKTAQDILNKLNTGSSEDKTNAMSKLSTLSADMTFALDFINKQGLTLIIKQIEGGKCKSTVLAHTLLSFVELMEHGIVSWDILNGEFISRVAGFVNTPQEAQITQAALSILENVVLNSTEGYGQVEREVPIGSLVVHLQAAPVVQQNAVALINALLSRADSIKRRTLVATLTSKQVRTMIQNNILQTGAAKGAEMAHQLYVLQTLMLGLLEQRMMTKMDPQDQDGHDKIKELRRIAFDNEGAGSTRGPGGFTRDYKKLGFKNDINPALDFTETPPGLLALDCMIYFARNHPENYTKLVLENSCRADEHECPFGRASVELVRILCELLKIGTRFTKYSARGQRIKDKFWYMRLSPNHKVLHYGDCDEKSAPSTEELQSKLAVSDIRALLVGRDCPHMKGRKASHQLAFSLALEGVDLQSLDCVAPDELALAYWTDGINALLGQRMQSKETEKDLDTLLSMEIKLRLLDAEGVTIPQDPPPIPPDPPHYHFCYDLK